LNLDRLQLWIDQGRIDPKKPITLRELNSSRCTHGLKDGVKLLAKVRRLTCALRDHILTSVQHKEQFKTPINIVVSRASQTAIEAVEAAGGRITTRYYTRPAIKRINNNETHPYLSLLSKPRDDSVLAQYKYRLPDPAGRKDIEYYRDPKHRGYLSYQVEDGHSPSLFFKTPGSGVARKKAVQKETGENKIW
jgi:large subunit ribosomal protein L15